MKSIIFCVLLFSSVFAGYSQFSLKSFSKLQEETQVGITHYDLQTNKLLQNRIYKYDDGSVGAVWIQGINSPPSFADRGTGYNYYDGSSWDPIPDNRIESFRSGWPSYAPYGPNGEIIICHDFAVKELHILTRNVKGTGTWTDNNYTYGSGPSTLACPRIITGGSDHNTIHLLAVSYDPYAGQDGAMCYSRSQDGGINWNIENTILEGTGKDYYYGINPDEYVWAEERAGTLAFLCASSMHDMFLMKSTDDGDNWEKTLIWEHPYPMFNASTITDTFFSVDNSAAIALDSQGKAHVVFGITRLIKETTGPNWYWMYMPWVDGIGYWNEDMDAFSNDLNALAPPGLGYTNSEMFEDYNYIGWMQDVNGNGTLDLAGQWRWYREQGASSMPTITIDEFDHIYVLYSSATETFEYSGELNYRHIWGRGYINGAWQIFVDLTTALIHLYDECIYPVLASASDNEYIHYMYQTDDIPGLAGDEWHDFHENKIYYAKTLKSDFLTVGINEDSEDPIRLEINVYPNPGKGIFNIEYEIFNNEYVCLKVYDSYGREVTTLVDEMQAPGKYTLPFDASEIGAGVYSYQLISMTSGKKGFGKLVVVE